MLRLTIVALALLFIGSIADVPAMFLAVRGMLPLPFIFIAGFLADVIPDFFWYWLGGKIGLERISQLRVKFFRQEEKRVRKAEHAFHRYGGYILFFSKFVYAFGIPSQIVAGAHRYSLKKMFVSNALGSAGWLLVLYFLAKAFNSVSIIQKYLDSTTELFLGFLAAAAIIYFVVGRPLARMLR